MDEKNDNTYSKETILIILLLFIFSNKLFDFFWNISKSLIYLVVIIVCLNYLNPNLSMKVKEIIINIINVGSNNSFITDILSKLSSNVLNLVKPELTTSENNIANNLKSEKDMIYLDNTKYEKNRNLFNLEKNNNINRRLNE